MRKIIVAAILVAAVSAFVYLTFVSNDSLDADVASATPEKSIAPDFTLTDMEGKSVSLSDFRGKVVLLNFWATWCPPCRAEMPSMERLYSEMRDKDFVLLAVNVEENGQNAVSSFVEDIPVSFPILFDSAQKISSIYRVSGIPQTYIIDKEGQIIQQVTGGVAWDSPEVRKYFSSLVEGGNQ